MNLGWTVGAVVCALVMLGACGSTQAQRDARLCELFHDEIRGLSPDIVSVIKAMEKLRDSEHLTRQEMRDSFSRVNCARTSDRNFYDPIPANG